MLTLTTLLVIPFLLALFILTLSRLPGKALQAVAGTLVALYGAALGASHQSLIGQTIKAPWHPAFGAEMGIQFYLTVDYLSILFIALTVFAILVAIISVRSDRFHSPAFFYSLLFLTLGLLVGFFTARDLLLFTVFWEAMLLPLFLVINVWGGEHRQAVALKFLVYMIAGSALIVAAVLWLYFSASGWYGFDLDKLSEVAEMSPYAGAIFTILLLAFAVKTPLFPFHGWLVDTYTTAPTPGTIVLSSILSKAGIYGIVRVLMPLFPTYMQQWGSTLTVVAIIGVLYGAVAAMAQHDFKRLIAYSSFSHVNFVLVGLFTWNSVSHTGAILQALNHGVTIAALFLACGWLQARIGTTVFGSVSGLTKFLPRLAWISLVFVASSVALPGTNSFVSELLILFGLFKVSPIMTGVLGISVVLSVIYMLRYMRKIFFEEPTAEEYRWNDLSTRELAMGLALSALIVFLGVYPAPVIDVIQPISEALAPSVQVVK